MVWRLLAGSEAEPFRSVEKTQVVRTAMSAYVEPKGPFDTSAAVRGTVGGPLPGAHADAEGSRAIVICGADSVEVAAACGRASPAHGMAELLMPANVMASPMPGEANAASKSAKARSAEVAGGRGQAKRYRDETETMRGPTPALHAPTRACRKPSGGQASSTTRKRLAGSEGRRADAGIMCPRRVD